MQQLDTFLSIHEYMYKAAAGAASGVGLVLAVLGLAQGTTALV
jgi:hypothetical protein